MRERLVNFSQPQRMELLNVDRARRIQTLAAAAARAQRRGSRGENTTHKNSLQNT